MLATACFILLTKVFWGRLKEMRVAYVSNSQNGNRINIFFLLFCIQIFLNYILTSVIYIHWKWNLLFLKGEISKGKTPLDAEMFWQLKINFVFECKFQSPGVCLKLFQIQFQFCPMDISSVYRLSILGSSTGLPPTSNSLSFALWKRGHTTRHDGRTPEQGMSKSGSALPLHTSWMLLQSKLNLVKTVAELMKEALSHAAIRNNLLCKGQSTVAYIKESNMAAFCPQLFNTWCQYGSARNQATGQILCTLVP